MCLSIGARQCQTSEQCEWQVKFSNHNRSLCLLPGRTIEFGRRFNTSGLSEALEYLNGCGGPCL